MPSLSKDCKTKGTDDDDGATPPPLDPDSI